MWGWETEGKGGECVARILYKQEEGREEAKSQADEGSCNCFAGKFRGKTGDTRVYFSQQLVSGEMKGMGSDERGTESCGTEICGKVVRGSWRG